MQLRDARQGYLSVYINDVQMDRARTAIKDIGDNALKREPQISTADVWNAAQSSGLLASQEQCTWALNNLFDA